MAEYHFPIPGGVDENKIVLFVRRHWASFLGQFFLSFAMFIVPAIILFILYLKLPNTFIGVIANIVVIICSIYYLIATTVAFISWLSFYYDIYIITDEEIIDIIQQGYFGRKISRQSILRVQDVSSDIDGILPTVFGYGNVLVETAGEQSQNFIIKSVPNPQEIAGKIMQLHNEIIARESREGELADGEGTLRPNNQNRMQNQNQNQNTQTQTPVSPPPPPPPPPTQIPVNPTPINPTPENNQPSTEDGEVSHDDLDQGGSVKFQ